MISPVYNIQFIYYLFKNYNNMRDGIEIIPNKNIYYNYTIYQNWNNKKYNNTIKDINDDINNNMNKNFKTYYEKTKKYLYDITKKIMKNDKSIDFDYYLGLIFDDFIYYLKKSIFPDNYNIENNIDNIENDNYLYNDLHYECIINLKNQLLYNKKRQKKQRYYKYECDELWKDYCACNDPLDRKINYEDIKYIIYEQYYDYEI